MKFLLTLAVLALGIVANAQQPTPTPDEAIRIDTALVQTAVTVADKKGRFVEGLRSPDFNLRVGGKPADITFFEEVSAGASREKQLRTGAGIDADQSAARIQSGRAIVFFLDDIHLALDSIKRTRDMLKGFVDKQMRDGDNVAIATAKGSIGFLQQFTDNRSVLRAAIDRITPVPNVIPEMSGLGAAPMTEYNALTIERRDDPRLFDFYVNDCMYRTIIPRDRRSQATARESCTFEVRNRARAIIIQAGAITDTTYVSFEHLLKTAARMPGRKLAFFISDGFLADSGPRGRASTDRVIAIAKKARQGGIVIYSIDARGTISGQADATGAVPMDPDGRLASANMRAISATQDAMNALAVDTGGRALRNQNYFDDFVTAAVAETSRYYLVAWRPEGDDPAAEVSKSVEITVPGRPELDVRAGKGTHKSVNTVAAARPPVQSKPGDEIRNALTDALPGGDIPIDLSATYLDVPGSGVVLTTSVQIPSDRISFGPQKSDPANITIAGVVLDDRGKTAASFSTGLKIDPPKGGKSANAAGVIYNHPAPLNPGIYQVRVVARDDKTVAVGSATQWVVIPDTSKKDLSVSSLLLGLESVAVGATMRSQWSIDHRFSRRKKLRFMGFVYNAARDAKGKTEIFAAVRIRRDGVEQTMPSTKRITLDEGTDTARVPVSYEIDLRPLTPGHYVLELTIDDRLSQKSVVQTATFLVE